MRQLLKVDMKPPYNKLQARWLRRRKKIVAWLATGMTRQEIAARLKITRQRLSVIEQEEKAKT